MEVVGPRACPWEETLAAPLRCALSSLHGHLLTPRSPHAGPLPPTHPASDHTWRERLAVRGLAGGSPHAWLHPVSPGLLPSLSPLTLVGPDPHLLLGPFPLLFHRYVPSKSLAWFIPFWGLLLKEPKLTQSHWEVKVKETSAAAVPMSVPSICPCTVAALLMYEIKVIPHLCPASY